SVPTLPPQPTPPLVPYTTLFRSGPASRHSRAASNSVLIPPPAPGSEREPALALGVVRTQLLEALEIPRFNPGDVLAAETGAVELHAGELRPGDRGLEVGQVLVHQPVAADHALDLLLGATVGDQLLGRGHVDAVDIGMPHGRRGRCKVDLA